MTQFIEFIVLGGNLRVTTFRCPQYYLFAKLAVNFFVSK